MEELLRSEETFELVQELFEKSFDYNSPFVLFPVRHHSPICSYHLKNVIDTYQPEVILIEGPETASELFPFMVSEETKAPFCIYLSYDDKQGNINKVPAKYRAYYPFLDYSPELTAMRMAAKRKIACKFIDLNYGEMLLNTPEREKEKEPYEDDHAFTLSDFYIRLTEKTGCQSFHELWEKLFENDGYYMETAEFVRNLFTYCYYTRYYHEKEESDIRADMIREAVMKEHVHTALKNNKKTLVVTGGMHTIALIEDLVNRSSETLGEQSKTSTMNIHTSPSIIRLKKEDSPAYLMPYSYEESDQASGYQSGMLYPYYYQKVWENMGAKLAKKPKKKAFEEAALSFIIRTANAIRKKQPLSIADEMQSYYMARGLASLREKKECGVFELIDGVRASFVKGEISAVYQPALKQLYRLLTGMEVGCVDKQAGVPPIVMDFESCCKKYKIQTNTSIKKQTKLDVYNRPDHREKSCFFQQMKYLETGFCTYLKSQEDNGFTGRILLRESWEYAYKPHVQLALIQVSAYGATLKGVCLTLVSKALKENHYTSKELADVLVKTEQMGLVQLYEELMETLTNLIGDDMDFVSVMDCFITLHRIHQKSEMLQSKEGYLPDLIKIKELALNRSFTLLYTVWQVNKDAEDKLLERIKYIYQYFIDNKDEKEEVFILEVQNIYQSMTVSGGLSGICAAILLKKDKLSLTKVFERFEAYIGGSEEAKQSAVSFLRGFFMVAKDVIFVEDRLILLIDQVLKSVKGELFLTLLPELRLAFTYFLPFEIDKIAKQVALLYHTGKEHVLYGRQVAQNDLEDAIRMDEVCKEAGRIWFGSEYK